MARDRRHHPALREAEDGMHSMSPLQNHSLKKAPRMRKERSLNKQRLKEDEGRRLRPIAVATTTVNIGAMNDD
uniref:Uncharacterized protein n=1 Tax=Panagrellus redivivus TaxID=6233 RepID=A0A7E4ZRC4_PANRE